MLSPQNTNPIHVYVALDFEMPIASFYLVPDLLDFNLELLARNRMVDIVKRDNAAHRSVIGPILSHVWLKMVSIDEACIERSKGASLIDCFRVRAIAKDQVNIIAKPLEV